MVSENIIYNLIQNSQVCLNPLSCDDFLEISVLIQFKTNSGKFV